MTASRYDGQTIIAVSQDDGTTRPMGVPRIAAPLTAAIRYLVREGDRIDLLANAGLGDSTGWWRIGDANPFADVFRDTEPGAIIAIPSE